MLQKFLDFFATATPNKDGGIDYAFKTTAYVVLVVLVLIFLAIVYMTEKQSKKIKTKQVVFAGAAMALAVVTSFIKFGSLPFGGSITLFSMFFICLIGYLYGIKVGLMTGFAYGILQLIVNPVLFHPMQILLDYPLAFGCLGLSGLFSKSKNGLIKGYLLGISGRYLFHVLSGYIFFTSYTPEGMNPILYVFVYNASYIVPEAVATIIILCVPSVLAGFKQVKMMANEA